VNNVEFLRNLENREITLNDWCEAFYDAKIFPLPTEEYSLFEQIARKTIDIFKLTNEYPYSGRRNEFGNHMENVLIAGVKEVLGIEAKNLGSGYPDVHFEYNGKNYYPECKVGHHLWKKADGFRMFYTSAPKPRTKALKNIKDGHHLLFHFEHGMIKDGPGVLTGRFKITDLDGFVYRVEAIQQGNAKDLYENHNKIIVENQVFNTIVSSV